MKKQKWFAAAVLVPALAVFGWASSRGEESGEQPGLATSTFKVEGMTCGGCEAGVRHKVGRLDGVEDVVASYKESRAVVTYDPAKVTTEQIGAAIEELGYSAELLGTAAAKVEAGRLSGWPGRFLSCC